MNRAHAVRLLCGVSMALVCSTVCAQNYERYAPLDLNRPDRALVPQPSLDVEKGKLPDVNVDDRVLVSSLDAIILIDSAEKLSSDHSIDELQGIHYQFADSQSIVYRPQIRSIIERELGQPITLRRLNTIARDMILQYRKCKLPIVDIQIPEQRITGGTVQLVVIESRVGGVQVQSGNYFSCEENRRWIECTQPGNRIYEPWIENDLLWLNQNPFRRVGVDFKPGSLPGTTDVIYQVRDVRPIRGYVGADDTGVPSLNYGRFFTGLSYGNLFGRGGLLGYQYTTDQSFSLLHAHSLSYTQPIDRRWSWMSYGSIADVTPLMGFGFNQNGQSWQVGTGMVRHLIRDRYVNANVSLGADFKSTNNNLEFAGQTVSNSTADLIQLRAGYDHFWRTDDLDEYGLMRLDTFVGPGGGFTSHHTQAAFNSIRPGTSPDYIYGRSRLERSRVIASQWQLMTRLQAQAASERLLFSETLGLGDYDSLRGYDQRAYSADHGWIANIEFGPRPWRWGCGQDQRMLRAYGFTDLANGYLANPRPAEDAYAMAMSVGNGLRYQASDRLIARLDYGIGLRDNIANVARNDRIHFGVTWIPGKRP